MSHMPRIPDDIANAAAAGRVPKGTDLSYLAQSRDKPATIAILFVGSFTTLVVTLRCYARRYLLKKFGLDDAIAVVTMPFYITFIVLGIILMNMGTGRHYEYIAYVMPLSDVGKAEKLDFIAHILYVTALFVCRLSGLAFYLRIAGRHPRIQLSIQCTAVFIVAGYLPQFFLLLLHCRPITGLWPYPFQTATLGLHEKCLRWGTVYGVNAGISLVCDIAMLVIPAILIARLQASRKKKIQLSFVLFPGVLVIALSCVRIWLTFQGNRNDGSWFYDPIIVVESSELGGTLIALSIPGLKPLVSKWSHHSRKSCDLRAPLTWQANRLNFAPDNVAYEMNTPTAKTLTPVSSNGESRSVAHDSDQELVRDKLKGFNSGNDSNCKRASVSEQYRAPDAHLSDVAWSIEENELHRMQRAASRESDNWWKSGASTLFTLPSVLRS